MWKSYTGEEILYNALDESGNISHESMLEDAVKQGINISSNGDCILLKLYYTDGFAWLFDGNKITFILHECKVDKSIVGKTIRGYQTCLRRALLQIIGYYLKIKNKEYSKFSKKLKDLAIHFKYDDINKFIIDNFGMFLITTPKFVCNIPISDNIKELISRLEPIILASSKSPSKYWDNEDLKQLMLNFDVQDIPFEMMPSKVDLADTGEILNNILCNSN